MLSFSPKREGKIGRGREEEGYILDPTLSTYCLFLRVVLLEDDWSSSSLATNLSIAFVQYMWFLVFYMSHNFKPAYQVTWSCLSMHIARSTSLIPTTNNVGGVVTRNLGGGAKFFTLAHTFHG